SSDPLTSKRRRRGKSRGRRESVADNPATNNNRRFGAPLQGRARLPVGEGDCRGTAARFKRRPTATPKTESLFHYRRMRRFGKSHARLLQEGHARNASFAALVKKC